MDKVVSSPEAPIMARTAYQPCTARVVAVLFFCVAVPCLVLMFIHARHEARHDGTLQAPNNNRAPPLWFVQVTDLHFSTMTPQRGVDFQRWVAETLPVLRPEVVIVSGDITHGVLRSNKVKQQREEWNVYKNSLEAVSVFR